MQTARGYSLGAVDYIPSPVVPEVLRSKVRVFVELHILQRRIARQADERVALAASEAALRLAEESTQRSSLLAGLSHSLSGVLEPARGHARAARPRGARAGAQRHGGAGRRARRGHARGHAHQPVRRRRRQRRPPALGPAQRAFRAAARGDARARGAWSSSRRSYVDGALQMLPLVHGDRFLGALWIDGELTPMSSALLDEVAARAAIAFATASLYGALQVEIAERRQAEARLEEAEPAQGRIPRDAGARAAQSAGADPQRRRTDPPGGTDRGQGALGRRRHRPPGAPAHAPGRRAAGRRAHQPGQGGAADAVPGPGDAGRAGHRHRSATRCTSATRR